MGHSASIQTTSRLPNDVIAHDERCSEGNGDPVRADFNTLDNPFAWVGEADEIGVLPAPVSTSSSSNPTETTSAATGERWTASYRSRRSSSNRAAAAGFNRCSRRRTPELPVPRAATAAFRSRSSNPNLIREAEPDSSTSP